MPLFIHWENPFCKTRILYWKYLDRNMKEVERRAHICAQTHIHTNNSLFINFPLFPQNPFWQTLFLWNKPIPMQLNVPCGWQWKDAAVSYAMDKWDTFLILIQMKPNVFKFMIIITVCTAWWLIMTPNLTERILRLNTFTLNKHFSSLSQNAHWDKHNYLCMAGTNEFKYWLEQEQMLQQLTFKKAPWPYVCFSGTGLKT